MIGYRLKRALIAETYAAKHHLIFRRCFCKKICFFYKWRIVANDCDFESFKIIALLKCTFLHKQVKHSLLKLSRLCHHRIKIMFFGYIKTLSVEIIQKYMATCRMCAPEVRVSSGQAEEGDRDCAGAGSADIRYSDCLYLPEKWRVEWGYDPHSFSKCINP